MNTTLSAASIWLNELGIKNQLFPNCLKVDRTDIENLGESPDVLLGEMRKGVNHNKLFWANKDDNWLFLESF